MNTRSPKSLKQPNSSKPRKSAGSSESLSPSTPPRHHNPASLGYFLREKLYFFLLAAGTLVLLLLFLTALRTSPEAIAVVVFLFLSFTAIAPTVEYWRRRNFYRQLLQNIASLDRAYLVLETLREPNFYDGRVLYEALYAINKSMAETAQSYELSEREFREYIEMWIHEVKTPLATLSLMLKDRKIAAQINRLDSYVEQVLYFARAENAERDYLIKPVSLAKIVGAVATKNQDLLLMSRVDLFVDDLDREVFTDSKWLEFILNQILLNSIKYQSTAIKISATADEEETILTIVDDGVGISAKDLPRVFDKSFTGENGHITNSKDAGKTHRSPNNKAASENNHLPNSKITSGNSQKSTGMGLYIAKTLCDKLGHQISIASPERQGAIVTITFPHHDYYTVLREKSLPKNRAATLVNHTSAQDEHTSASKNHASGKNEHDLSKK